VQITESVRKIHRYEKSVEAMTNETLKKLKPVIAKMNVQQLERGQKPDGSLYEGYSPATENYVRATPITAGEPIKLKDTGKFHEGIFTGTVMRGKNIVEIKSRDEKSDMLEHHYKPFGLTENNMDKITERIYKELYKQLKDYFNG